MSSSSNYLVVGKIYKVINQSAYWIKGPGNLKKKILLEEGILLYIGKDDYGNELFSYDAQILLPSLGLITRPSFYLEEIKEE